MIPCCTPRSVPCNSSLLAVDAATQQMDSLGGLKFRELDTEMLKRVGLVGSISSGQKIAAFLAMQYD